MRIQAEQVASMSTTIAASNRIGSLRFQNALARTPQPTPPIWLMRQAGRYHRHYQALRQKHSFMELCKEPNLAAEVALGPVLDFDFDAAILFSDLLFPLEALGMGLEYTDRGPQLGWKLDQATLGKVWGFLKYHHPAVARSVASSAFSGRCGTHYAQLVAGKQEFDRICRGTVDLVRLCRRRNAQAGKRGRRQYAAVCSVLRNAGSFAGS